MIDLSQEFYPCPKVYKAKKEPAPIKKVGKKGKEWIEDRAKLIKEAVIDGRIELIDEVVVGVCEDCKKLKPLDPDHRLKRSQGGSNDKENIDWVCRKCHDNRDNQGDPLNKKERKHI
jgi:5-methylcytosine-specific restriction endonuclease McrA